MNKNFTAIIQEKDARFVSPCPELHIANQGNTIEETKKT
jgi:predicted RNase H-like HicB family nuclease